MIEFVLAMGMVVFVIVGGLMFLVWVIRQHSAAKKWRRIVEFAQSQPPQPLYKAHAGGWEVSYKDKGKIKTEIFPGETEAQAIGNAIRGGANVKKILGTRKL